MSQMFKISLPDGSVREVARGSTPADIAAAIGPGLAKATIAARVDGELRDANRPFDGDATLALVTTRDEADALELARHDFAHVMAEAVHPHQRAGWHHAIRHPPARQSSPWQGRGQSRRQYRQGSILAQPHARNHREG